jgi:hypothetical protein
MKKYVVHARCLATDFIFVEANSKEEAIERVSMGEGDSATEVLEFHSWRSVGEWDAEELEPYRHPKKKEESESVSDSSYSEWEFDFGQQEV